MKVEIWSDVVCPFCYIGKRKFESALQQFPEKDKIEIEWKSFQLDPGIKTDPSKTIYQYLAERKGMSLEQAKQMSENVVNIAAEIGLNYNFDKAVVANTLNAHRLLQLAKKHMKGNIMEEALFNAYFIQGKNIADPHTLLELAEAVGLDGKEVQRMLESSLFTDEVQSDIQAAQNIGVRGVPFFVMNSKYAVSGAQDTQVFLQALKKSFAEWQKENLVTPEIIEGKVCTPEGDCD